MNVRQELMRVGEEPMKRTPLLIVVLILNLLMIALSGCAVDSPDAGSGDVGGDLEWAIAIHGGAGTIPKSDPEEISRGYRESLKQALEIGRSVLQEGGTALDAVEKVLIFMEDDPHFNAGKGAVYNRDGGHELDASIMDGSNLACGAVGGVTTVKNPIILARRVMSETRHVLLMGEGAERFADVMGVERVEPSYFDTERRHEQWRRHIEKSGGGERSALVPAETATLPRDRGTAGDTVLSRDRGTVGAVALDRKGNLAAATSTGGLTGKMFGRIGDTPIIGAGNYASNAGCAVSGTGTGEEFIRHNVAYRVSALMEYKGLSLQDAAEEVVHRILKPGDGGIIAADRRGNLALVFNSNGMYRGAADSSGRFEVAIWE